MSLPTKSLKRKLRNGPVIDVDPQILKWRRRRKRAAKARQEAAEEIAKIYEAEERAADPKYVLKRNLFE